MNNWTVEKVKDELPDVRVQVNKTLILDGRIAGRKLDFASVMFVNNGVMATCQFSWKTIVDCLNGERPLRY